MNIPVHPHTCGVNAVNVPSISTVTRFIPTHVGLMPSFLAAVIHIAVYPHTLGVNAYATEGGRVLAGSSPHMWG